MLPSQLKLASLNHCYIHLPDKFIISQPTLKTGATVSIRSVQNDVELIVMWNGSISNDHAQLDITFAQANGLRDELVVLCPVDNVPPTDCSECRVELIDSADYTILSQHNDANLLDSCRLISRDLVLPIFLSEHVKVLVRVVSFEPTNTLGLLTRWTEMTFQHNLKDVPKPAGSPNDHDKFEIIDPITIVSSNLGIENKAPFYLGSVLVQGDKGSGKTYYLKSVIEKYRNVHSEFVNCQQLRGKRPEVIRKRFSELLTVALDNQPSIISLDDIDSLLTFDQKHEEEHGQDVIYRKRLVDIFCQLIKKLERSDHPKGRRVILLASCHSFENLDERISQSKGRRFFTMMIKLSIPTLPQRCIILRSILEEQQFKNKLEVCQMEDIARRCNSFMPSDLRRLVERAVIAACSRSSCEFSSEPLMLEYSDLIDSLEGYVPHNLRGVSLQPKTRTTFDRIGGLKIVKDELLKTIMMQIKYPKLYKRCPMKPRNSILLYGPPGCGKTLIAEALTNYELINSICVRGPELLSKYIGASEAAVRDLFKRAEMARPCVVFFDEFESLVSKRGSDSTGVTDRVVNQFLTLMDGVDKLSSDVFLIGATSRPDMIDPAILRPGRLDKHIYCPMPSTSDRREILQVLSRDMNIENKSVIISRWSEKLEMFSGADIQSFLYSAQLKALHEIVGPTDFSMSRAERETEKKDLKIVVRENHLVESFREMESEVTWNFATLNERYPRKIGRTNGQVSTRATLA